MSIMKLKLEYWPKGAPDGQPRWMVLQVIGSTAHNPGDFLTKPCVEDLCQMTGMWEVTIVQQKVVS